MSNMIADPEGYFRGVVPTPEFPLDEMEREALAQGLPIVGPLVGEMLFLLTRIMNAARVLELGTCTGYSAICLARGLAPGGRLTSLEMDEALAERARRHIASAGLSDRVEVLGGRVESVLPGLTGPYDLVFIDIDKEGYAPALPQAKRLLRPGGLLVADNTAFADADPFNRAVFADPAFRSVHLYAFLPCHSPEHDALTLAVKTGA